MGVKYIRLTVYGRELVIRLPYSYGVENRRFPVVYLQDEGSVMKHTANYLDHLFRAAELKELILVGIASADRNHDYTPWPLPAVTSGAPAFGGGGEDYLKALVEEIKPYIDRNYLTLDEPQHTGIIGYSLGGLISLYASYRYPGVFGRIGLLSASFWYEGILDYMREHPVERPEQRIYMYVGDLEGCYKTNVQKEMVGRTRMAHQLLLAQGFGSGNLVLEGDPDGTHDLMFFSRQFPPALKWLFGGARQSGE
ncbi:esterase [Paenibacillus sp. PK3_47]|uniref:alpha/beta hydrolase n=1 Tax=Paenibacillus sp. PK3_47 TaxID=2072642 RepID=UPI00201D6540|nr:alpha/beta hydrolase-fold protein [Paenibacillus sp. PK3_47]UQZ35990.1 esterase [Paenibacillus sp. PK3_47]